MDNFFYNEFTSVVQHGPDPQPQPGAHHPEQVLGHGGPHRLSGVLQGVEVGVGDVAGFTLHDAPGGVI